MISNYKKQEYLQEINILLHAINLAIDSGLDQKDNLEQARKLKRYIESENDITLEEIMQEELELKIQYDPELSIKIRIEEIRSKIPEKYIDVSIKREKYNAIFPEWLKIALIEHSEWEEMCINMADIISKKEYKRLVEIIPEIFEFLPIEYKNRNPQLCKNVIETNPELLKFVPIYVIELDINFWSTYFNAEGIDIKLFARYDEKIRKQMGEKGNCITGAVEMLVEAQRNGKVLYLPEEIKLRFPKTTKTEKKEEKQYKRELSEAEIKEYIIRARKGDMFALYFIPKSFLISDFELCKDMCDNNRDCFKIIPDEVKLANPEWAMEYGTFHFASIPDEIKIANPEWAKREVENESRYNMRSLPEQIQLDDIEWTMKMSKDGMCFYEISEKVKLLYPKWCMKEAENSQGYFLKGYGSIPVQVILTNPKWYIKTTLTKDRALFSSNERLVESAKKDLEEFQNEYMKKYYCYGELNFESLRKSCPEKINKDKVLQRYQERMPIMKNICQEIIEMDSSFKSVYFRRVEELVKRGLKIREKKTTVTQKELESFISDVSSLELEIRKKNNRLQDTKKAQSSYDTIKKDIEEKIAMIEGINPRLAQKYREKLESSEQRSIEHMAITGMPYQELINLSNQVDFFVSANFPKKQTTEITIYKPKKQSVWSKVMDRIKGKTNQAEGYSKQRFDGILANEDQEYDEESEPSEFAKMSLEDLKRKKQELEVIINEKERNERSNQEGR